MNDNLESIELLSDSLRASNLLNYVNDIPAVFNNILNVLSGFANDFTRYLSFIRGNELQDEENRREANALLRGINANTNASRTATQTPPAESSGSGFLGPIIAYLGIKKLLTFFANIGKLISKISLVKIVKFIESIPIIGKPFIRKIAPLISFLEDVAKFVGKIPGLLKLVGRMGKFAPLIGQIILVIVGINDAIRGAIEGYKTDGILGAIRGAIKGFFVGLVGSTLNLLKDGLSWVATKLGFDGIASTLDSIDFESIVGKTLDFIFKFIDVVAGIVVGIGQWLGYVLAPVVEILKTGLDMFKTFLLDMLKFTSDIFVSIGKGITTVLEYLGIDKYVDENIIKPCSNLLDGLGKWLSEVWTSAKDKLKGLFGGEDMTLENFYKSIIRGMLPDPREHTDPRDPFTYIARAIPKDVYDYAGMDITGDSPTKQLEKAAKDNKFTESGAADFTTFRRAKMSDADFAALPREEKAKIAQQFQATPIRDRVKEPQMIKPVPSTKGDVLATAGSQTHINAPTIIHNTGGNVHNTSMSTVSNNSTPFEPIMSGSSLGFGSL
jgi:hypothetical protein